MRISILAERASVQVNIISLRDVQLLTNSSCSFRWTRGLNPDDFDEIDDAAHVLRSLSVRNLIVVVE